jgi:uncharacterized protein
LVQRLEQPGLYFWRDAHGHEVDVVVDLGQELIPVEAKSAQTIASDFFDNLNYWREVSGIKTANTALIYGGGQSFKRSGAVVYPWFAL